MTAEYRIAALEAQLAKILRLLHETSSRLDDHKEDIGAIAHAVNRLEGHTVDLSESRVRPKKA